MATILRITSQRAGFRRAGIAHAATPVDHARERFTAPQIAALMQEPMLRIEQIEVDDRDPGDEQPPMQPESEAAGPQAPAAVEVSPTPAPEVSEAAVTVATVAETPPNGGKIAKKARK